MNCHRIGPGLLLGAALAVTGCKDRVPDDPLMGTWHNTTCFGTPLTPPDIARCTLALTFRTDLGIDLKAEWVSLPATSMHPGCITTRRVTGQNWSTKHATADSESLTVTGTGAATIERTDCLHMENNLKASPTSDISIASSTAQYQISDDMLIIPSGDLAGTYSH